MPTENILLVSKMEIQWVLTSMHTTLTKELSGSSTSSTSYKNCIRMKFEFRRKTYPTLPQKRLHNLLFISISYKQKQINLFELDLIGDFTWSFLLLLLVFSPHSISQFHFLIMSLFVQCCCFTEIVWNRTRSIGMHCYCLCESLPNGLYERIRNSHNCVRAHCAVMQPVYKNNW